MADEIKIDKVLKHLMKNKNFTFKKLSKETGVPESTLKTWSSGIEPKSLIPARKVARVLGISVEYLIFGNEENESLSLNDVLTKELFSGWCKITIEVPSERNKK